MPSNSSTPSTNLVQGTQLGLLSQEHTIQLQSNQALTIHPNKSQVTLFSCNNDGEMCAANQVTITYEYYPAYQGDGQKSGAYIFRPDSNYLNKTLVFSTLKTWTVFTGDFVNIIRIVGERSETQMRTFRADGYPTNVIELETFLGSIPTDDKVGKEVVLRIQTDIKNNQVFYTDSNGLDMQTRKINGRDYPFTVDQPVAGNYYPVNGIMYIQDVNTGKRVVVQNDRVQGGASINEGQLEFMINRRLFYDDGRGVGEPLDERNAWNNDQGLWLKARHIISFTDNKDLSNFHRVVQKNIDEASIVLLAQTATSTFPANVNPTVIAPLLNAPSNVKVYLRPVKTTSNYMLRLHNLHESQSQNVDATFGSIEERTITGVQSKADMLARKLKWNEESTEAPYNFTRNATVYDPTRDDAIEVLPMQIRTFYVTPAQLGEVSITI